MKRCGSTPCRRQQGKGRGLRVAPHGAPFRAALAVPSDTRYLSPLRDWLAAAAEIVGRRAFPPRARIACSLALIEAVDNAIFHAHRRRSAELIRVAISVRRGKIALEVADEGSGIGRHRRPVPEAMVSSGRGLFLIHRLMHQVESRRRGGRHVLRMIHLP